MTESLKIGDLVWAKMKGFSPWPGLVSNPTKDIKKPASKKPNIHCIFFFGSNNYAWIEENNIKPYLEYKEQLMKSNKSTGFKEACEAIEKFIKDKSDNPDEGPDAAFDRLRASLELDKQAENADVADFDGDDSVGPSSSTPKQRAKKDKALKKRVSGPRQPKFTIAHYQPKTMKLLNVKRGALQAFGDAPRPLMKRSRYKEPVSAATMALQRELDLAVQEFFSDDPPTPAVTSAAGRMVPVQHHFLSGGESSGSTSTQLNMQYLLGQPVKKKTRKKMSHTYPVNIIKKRAGLLAKKLVQGSKHRLKNNKLSQEMMDLQEALDHTVLSFTNNDVFLNVGVDVAEKGPFVSLQKCWPENSSDKVQPSINTQVTFVSKTAVSPKSSPSKTNKTVMPEASPLSPSLPEAAELITEQMPVAAHIEVPYTVTDIKVPSIVLPTSTNDTASTVLNNTTSTVIDIKLPVLYRVPNIVATTIATVPNDTAVVDIKLPSAVLHRVPTDVATAVPKNNASITSNDPTVLTPNDPTVPDIRLPSLHELSATSTVLKTTPSIQVSTEVPAVTNSVPEVQIEPSCSKASLNIPNACTDMVDIKCTDTLGVPKEYKCVVMSCSKVEEKKPSAIPFKPTRVPISMSPSPTDKSESVPKKKRRTSGTAETSTPTPKRSRKVSMDTSEDYDMDASLMNHSQKKANASSSLLDRPSNVIRPDTPPLDVESVTQTLKEKNILPSMLKFGFLGLGIMGSGIVKNLLNSGHSVIVWNRTPAKCKDFVKAGAEECLTPSDVVQAADITFSCVADPKAAKEMVFGNCGVLLEITPNKGYVEMTGIDSETSHDIADAIQAKGGRYLEAQIQGSKTQAEEGTLVILAAGDRSLFDDCQSCFQAMGRNSFYLGEVGNASKMNLVLQLMSGVTLAGLAEGMALADRAGLQQKDVLEVLELTSLACSTMIEKSKAIIEGGFPTHLPLQHLQKDLKLSLIMGDTLEQPLPLTATANEVFKHAKRLGYGDHDASAVYIRARF